MGLWCRDELYCGRCNWVYPEKTRCPRCGYTKATPLQIAHNAHFPAMPKPWDADVLETLVMVCEYSGGIGFGGFMTQEGLPLDLAGHLWFAGVSATPLLAQGFLSSRGLDTWASCHGIIDKRLSFDELCTRIPAIRPHTTEGEDDVEVYDEGD